MAERVPFNHNVTAAMTVTAVSTAVDYDENNITEAESLEDIMALIESQTTEHAYILATYTAMLQFREILASRHAVGKEMN